MARGVMRNNLFLDTAYVLALASKRDRHHEYALDIAEAVEQAGARVVTTEAVLIEIGNALSAPADRPTAVHHVEELRQASDVEAQVVRVSEDLFERGFALYKGRSDKSWGLTDCISFVVMRERGLHDALTTDSHFEQAGFNALLRE